MSIQNIIDKILSDAQAEANATLAAAESQAAKLLAQSTAKAEQQRRDTEREVAEKTQSVLEKRAADARLESAKILLQEKRKAVDSVYALALQRLVALPKEDALKLAATLLEKYAEEGDELFFAENFKYADEVSLLPVVQARKLVLAKDRLPLDGGMKLVGRVSDKDLSFGALLATDKDAYQAKLAKALFK